MSSHVGPAKWWTTGTNAGKEHIAKKGVNQSGLVLNLDAGVSASYPGTGTTWYDLSSTGVNVTADATKLSTNGLASGVVATSSSSSILDTDTHSIFFMIRFETNATYTDGTNGNYERIFGFAGSGDRSPGVWRNPSARTIHWRYDPGNTGTDFGVVGTTPFATNTWYYVGVTKNGANAVAYSNGNVSTTFTVANPKTTGSSSVYLFGGLGYSYVAPATLNCLNVYNRVLSQSEIQKNFNALRTRFGI